MSIVYITKNGTKYAYNSESYYDPIRKQARPKRTYLGKVDPVTGKITKVRTKERKPDTGNLPSELSVYKQQIAEQKETIRKLESRIRDLEYELNHTSTLLSRQAAELNDLAVSLKK